MKIQQRKRRTQIPTELYVKTGCWPNQKSGGSVRRCYQGNLPVCVVKLTAAEV